METKDEINEMKEIKDKLRDCGYVINRLIKEAEKRFIKELNDANQKQSEVKE